MCKKKLNEKKCVLIAKKKKKTLLYLVEKDHFLGTTVYIDSLTMSIKTI